MNTLNPRQVFDEEVGKAHAGMLNMLPANTEDVEQAYGLIVAGAVTRQPNTLTYTVEDEDQVFTYIKGPASKCTCSKGQASTYCHHHIAVQMYAQAAHKATKRLRGDDPVVPEMESSQHETQTDAESAAGPQEGLETDALPADAGDNGFGQYTEPPFDPDAAMHVPTAPTHYRDNYNHEPHSFTIKGVTSQGYEFMPCLRGHDMQGVLDEVETLLQWMAAHGIQGVYGNKASFVPSSPQAEGGQSPSSPQANTQLQEGFCQAHNVQMSRSRKGPGWYHRIGENKYCDGRWCERHDTKLWANEDGTFSHKLGKEGKCNG